MWMLHELESFDDNYKASSGMVPENGQTVFKLLARYKFENATALRWPLWSMVRKMATADDFNKECGTDRFGKP